MDAKPLRVGAAVYFYKAHVCIRVLACGGKRELPALCNLKRYSAINIFKFSHAKVVYFMSFFQVRFYYKKGINIKDKVTKNKVVFFVLHKSLFFCFVYYIIFYGE